jgi:hypothetical protein
MNYVHRRKDKLIKKGNVLQTPLILDRMDVASNFVQEVKRDSGKTIIFRLSAVTSITNIMDGTLNGGTMDSNQPRKFVLKKLTFRLYVGRRREEDKSDSWVIRIRTKK